MYTQYKYTLQINITLHKYTLHVLCIYKLVAVHKFKSKTTHKYIHHKHT